VDSVDTFDSRTHKPVSITTTLVSLLSLLFGVIVGFSLGLTGGGGAIFAVPLLVYGLGVPPREAVTVSLAAVGLTALVGAIGRWRSGHVEVRTGLLFALAGMLGAPVGTWVAGFLPDVALLLSFAALMLLVAVRLWRRAGEAPQRDCDDLERGPTCRRDSQGRLQLTSRCALLLSVVGVQTGVLSGLFGVSGGFVIVPALVMFSGLGMHRAVATSMLVITLVSGSGFAAHLWSGRACSVELVALFAAGGVAGMFLGQQLAQRISGATLQRVFAVAIVAVAIFIIGRNLAG
jgi:hypothetical protein